MAQIIVSDRVHDAIKDISKPTKDAYAAAYMKSRRSGWTSPAHLNERGMFILPIDDELSIVCCDIGQDSIVFIELTSTSIATARAESLRLTTQPTDGGTTGMVVISDEPAPPQSADAIRQAMESDESKEHFWKVNNDLEFERMLAAPLEKWRVFLHPSQRKIVTRPIGAPMLVRGGAGTGKTVVAMHRAKFLAESVFAEPQDRILFTTFSSNLAADIARTLDSLVPNRRDRERIVVMHLDAWVSDFLKKNGYDREVRYHDRHSSDDEIGAIWQSLTAQFPVDKLSPEFIEDEWSEVVQDQGIVSKIEYLKASRAGRGTPLSGRQKADLWPIFENFRAQMEAQGLAEPEDAYRHARSIIEFSTPFPAYRAVVVDEIQDMGSEALRLIRSIVPPSDTDGLFMVGDAHQRIYARSGSLKRCGIEVRGGGRSARLRLNYRTSEEILRHAVSVLKGIPFPDMDDDIDTLEGYRSVFHGEDPSIIKTHSASEEVDAALVWLSKLQTSGIDSSRMAILGRTRQQLDTVARGAQQKGVAVHRLANGKPDDSTIPGIRLSTLHRAKGLEFDAVAIVGCPDVIDLPDWLDKHHPDVRSREKALQRERSLYHVGMTRARHHLLIVHS